MHRAHFPQHTNYVREAKIEVWAAPRSEIQCMRVADMVSNNDHSHYHQLRIEHKEIRVVDVQPAKSQDEIVHLHVRHVRLDDTSSNQGTYDALSYCWGTTEREPQLVELTIVNPEEDLRVDESSPSTYHITIQVTRSLLLALKRLRDTDRPRTLWIDQLCINQADFVERASQVALMKDIYASSNEVYVWLGENAQAQGDCRVIREISHLYNVKATSRGDDADMPADDRQFPSQYVTHNIIKDNNTGYTMTGNNSVLELPWFERVWVLQEVWNASKVKVLCGPEELRWDEIMQANQCFKKHAIGTATVMSRLWTALFEIERSPGSISCHVKRDRLDILKVLIAGHDMKATDPRDKIFALLSFGHETRNIADLPSEVRPNYEKDTIDVYADFTRWWILHHRSLKILSAVHTLTGRSWVNMSGPYISNEKVRSDLGQRPSWIFWHEGSSEYFQGTLALHDKCTYTAAGGRIIDEDLIRSVALRRPGCLALRGSRIGTITELVHYPVYQDPPLSPDIQKAFMRVFDPAGVFGTWNSFKIRHSIEEEFELVTIADKFDEWRNHYLAHWNFQEPPLGGNERYGPNGNLKPTWLPCSGRCMFWTSEGWIGLCPSGTAPGDVIAILYGGTVPYVLRLKESNVEAEQVMAPSSREYYLVGECFVDGAMDGDICSSSGLLEEVFLLV